jgi:peptidoglycan L-alanyl-D-glutamate endopeptidase CwlK
MEVVKIMKDNGWEWGGDWKKLKDKPHFQKTFGFKWQDLIKKYRTKDFITGTEYVNI